MKKLCLFLLLGCSLLAGVAAQTPTLSGTIARPGGEPVPNVTVDLTGDATGSDLTGPEGNYLFSGLPLGADLTVTPFKNDDPSECVSVRDILAMAGHITGTRPLQSPFAILSADVTNDQNISTLDILALQSLLLGETVAFPNQTSWTFIPADYGFSNVTNPWVESYPISANINDLQSDAVVDFVAIKTGDPTGCAENDPEPAFLTLAASEVTGLAGEQVQVDVTASGFTDVTGLQLSLVWNAEILQFEQLGNLGLPNLGPGSFNTTAEGQLLMAWVMPTLVPQTLAEGAVVFSLTFTLVGDPGDTAPLSFTDAPLSPLVIDAAFLPFAINFDNGSATVLANPMPEATFTTVCGDTVYNVPNKIKAFGDGVYVAGTGRVDGSERATFSKYSIDGDLIWTIGTFEAAQFTDFEHLPATDEFLLIGNTLPFQSDGVPQDNASLLFKVDDNANVIFGIEYRHVGRESFSRIVRHLDPRNAAFPFYITGTLNPEENLPFYPDPPSATDRVFVYNLNENGVVNWAKTYDYAGTDVPDEEFHRGLIPVNLYNLPGDGDLVLTGNDSPANDGIVVRIHGGTGEVLSARRLSAGLDIYDGFERPDGELIIAGEDFFNDQAFVARLDENMSFVSGLRFGSIERFREIGIDAVSRLFAAGPTNVAAGLDRNVIQQIQLDGSGFAAGPAWYLDNGETAYTRPRISATPQFNRIYYADGRIHPDNGFGGFDVLVSGFDPAVSTDCRIDFDSGPNPLSVTDNSIEVTSDALPLPPLIEARAEKTAYSCRSYCAVETCSIAFSYEPLDCGAIQFTAQVDNADQIVSFAWDFACDGSVDSEQAGPVEQFAVCGETVPVCFTVEYSNGLVCTYEETITVPGDDQSPPMVGIPFNVTATGVNIPGVGCQAEVTVPLPIVTDNCTMVSMTNDYTGTADASGIYPAGTTIVIYTVADACGNSRTFAFGVTVECPVCDEFAILATEGACGEMALAAEGVATGVNEAYAWDLDCDGTIDAEVAEPVFDFAACGGERLVCLTTSYKGVNICTTEKTLVWSGDTEPPTIDCPSQTVVVSTDPGACTYAIDLSALVEDDCDPDPAFSYTTMGATTVTGTESSLLLELGATTIGFTATDACGNASPECGFRVLVEDNEPPKVVCPTVPVQTVLGCSAGAIVDFVAATATDNCVPPTLDYSHQSGDFFSCGTTSVTVTATDAEGNESTCAFPVIVQGCDDCARIVERAVLCGSTSGQYEFTLLAENLTGLDFCAATVEIASSQGPISNLTWDCTTGTITGTLTVDPPLPNPLELAVTFDFDCPLGPLTCTLPVEIETPCCESIQLADQTICTTEETIDLELTGDLAYIDNIEFIRWYVSSDCENYSLLYAYTPGSDPAEWSTFSFPTSLYAGADVICAYAEIVSGGGAPCPLLRSDTAAITLCDPGEGSLSFVQLDYCSTDLPATFPTIAFAEFTEACDYTFQWYDADGAIDGATGPAFVPEGLTFAGDPQDCEYVHTFRLEITSVCGSRELSADIRIYNDAAPVGELSIDPEDSLPLCYGDATTLYYDPACVGPDSLEWSWWLSTDGVSYEEEPGFGTVNPVVNTNRLYQDMWYKVVKYNGSCAADEAIVLVEVENPLTITDFTATADDSCDPTQVNLELAFTPYEQACMYTVDWYHDGQLIGSSVVMDSPATFSLPGPGLEGNHYSILRDDCCGQEVGSEVITLPPTMEIALSAPCFRCNDQTVTLEVLVENPPGACTYQWYQNGSPIPGANEPVVQVTQGNTTYSVEVDCGGCQRSASYFLLQCTSDPSEVCECGTLAAHVEAGFSYVESSPGEYECTPDAALSAECDQITWQWGDETADSQTVGAEPVTHTFAEDGPVDVCMEVTRTDANGTTCTESFCMTITEATDLPSSATVRMYPNPATTELRLEFADKLSGENWLQIRNATGQVVINTRLGRQYGPYYISLNGLPVGYYSIRILSSGNVLWSDLFFKQ